MEDWGRGHIVGNMCGSRGGGDRGSGPPPPPPEKSQKYRVSVLYWSGSPVKSHSYQANFQCWATNGPPAKRHLNGVPLLGRWWPVYIGIWIISPIINERNTESKLDPLWKNFLDPRMGNDVRLFTLSLHKGIHPHFRHLKIWPLHKVLSFLKAASC